MKREELIKMKGEELFEEILKVAERINPNFDRNKRGDMEVVVKSIILTLEEAGSKDGAKELKENYFKFLEETEKTRANKFVEENGLNALMYVLRRMELEKECLDVQIKTIKSFLN